MNKKILIAIAVICAAILAVTAFLVTRTQHTVSDFSIYPCRFDRATSLAIDSSDGRLVLAQAQPGEWRISSPYNEKIAREPHTELMQFLIARMFIDEQAVLSADEKQRLQKPNAKKVTFYNGDQVLCSFELGHGYKLPTVDSERRWIFPEGSEISYRTFVPLMDFGPLFEQPFGAWRERIMVQIPSAQFKQIEISAPGEQLVIARTENGNSRDYYLASAKQNDEVIDVSSFAIDPMRVATLIELAAPLFIDDWAEDVDGSGFVYTGRLTIRTDQDVQYMEIGPEVDYASHPQWAYLGEGARFVRNRLGRIGVVSAQRLMGLFPSLNDLRAKKVWDIDTTRISAIDVRVTQNCLRYLPVSKEAWAGTPCDWFENNALSGEQPQNLDMKQLATLAQTIQRLVAVRYAEPQEMTTNGATLDPPEAELYLYFDLQQTPTYILRLSGSVKNLYRYANIRTMNGDSVTDGPTFVLSEGIVRILLSDLRVVPRRGAPD